MLQKSNILKLFLIAGLCLMFFGAAGEGKATTITVNSDKTLNVNGKKTFPVGMYHICSTTHDNKNGYESCGDSVAKLSNFTYGQRAFPGAGSFWDTNAPLYANAGIYYTTDSTPSNIGSRKNEPYFFGYYQNPEEPSSPTAYSNLYSRYNSIKANDPNHPVMVSMWTYKPSGSTYNASQVADIVEDATYAYKTSCGYNDRLMQETNCGNFQYFLDDFIFAKERGLKTNILSPGGTTSTDGIPKPLYMITEAYGMDWVEGKKTWRVIPENKLRAYIYWAITAGYSGIDFWGYKFWGNGTTSFGLVSNATIAAYYNKLAGELTSPEMQSVLTLPTVGYSWNYDIQWDNKVIFSTNPTRKTYTSWTGYALTYRLKYDSISNRYYLIVVNKMNAGVPNVRITISGPDFSGTLKARTMGTVGTGSSAPNRELIIINGVFTDTFDGYAVHIYQICPVGDPCTVPSGTTPTPDTADPSITIDCPTGTPTYNTNLVNFSGTATDDVAVSKVEYKIDSGSWQTLTGSISPSWSISNLNIGAVGAHTIIFRATDTASPPKTAETSIQVTYDSSTPPPPAIACTKFVAKTGNDANPGTEALPFLTIQKAANVAVAGDTVCVKAGTYIEEVNFPNSGTSGNYITFQNYLTDIVTILPPVKIYHAWNAVTPNHHSANLEIIGESYIKLKGFVFGHRNEAGGVPSSAINIAQLAHHIIIDGNSFINFNENEVIRVGYFPPTGNKTAWNIDIINNYITSETRYDLKTAVSLFPELISIDHGESVNTSYNTFYKVLGIVIDYKVCDNCIVSYNKINHSRDYSGDNGWKNNLGNAIYVGGYLGDSSNISVFNNIVLDGDHIGVGSECGGLGKDIFFYNNIIEGGYEGFSVPLWISPSCREAYDPDPVPHYENIQFYNNIAINSSGYLFRIQANQADMVLRNNIIYGSGSNSIASSVTQDHNSWNLGITDPQFENPAANNFKLKSSSPAINAGISTGAPAFDFAGNKRPVGSGFDIGAYEYCVGAECIPDPSAGPSSNLPPTCTAPTSTTPPPASLCGNGVIDPPNEVCDTLNNFGCPASSACNSSCTLCAPVAVCSPKEGDSCTSKNMCGDISSPGTILCNGSCSSPIPPLDPQVNQLCSSPLNSCNQSASGYTDCSGLCKAVSPPLPLNYGKDCFSAQNQCNQSSPGKVGCSGCDALPPALPAGLDDGNSCTIDTCDKDGNIYHSNSCGGLIPCGRAGDNPATADIDESQPCTLCAFFYLLKNIINYILTLAMGIGVFVLVLAGLIYAFSVGDTRKIELAKTAIAKTIGGIIIIFIAWMAVAIILQALGYANAGVWNQVNCGV